MGAVFALKSTHYSRHIEEEKKTQNEKRKFLKLTQWECVWGKKNKEKKKKKTWKINKHMQMHSSACAEHANALLNIQNPNYDNDNAHIGTLA